MASIAQTTKQLAKQDIKALVAGDALDKAYAWLLVQRKNHSHNNSIWHLRHHWDAIKPALQKSLLLGEYRINPVIRHRINGEYVSSWDASDAIVLKALALTLQTLFTEEDALFCTHLKGGGGIHEAVRKGSKA